MGGGAGLVRKEDREEEVQDAGKDASEHSSGMRTETAGRVILSTQNGALPYRAIPRMDKEHKHGGMRVVSVQDTNTELPVQRVQAMEIAAENNVGRSPKSHRQREESLQNPRPPGEQARHPANPRLPTHRRSWKQGGPRAVPLEPGDEEAEEHGSKEEAEDEELEGGMAEDEGEE